MENIIGAYLLLSLVIFAVVSVVAYFGGVLGYWGDPLSIAPASPCTKLEYPDGLKVYVFKFRVVPNDNDKPYTLVSVELTVTDKELGDTWVEKGTLATHDANRLVISYPHFTIVVENYKVFKVATVMIVYVKTYEDNLLPTALKFTFESPTRAKYSYTVSADGSMCSIMSSP